MKIWDNLDNFDAKNPIVTIGSFDGVHRGHLEVMRQLDNIARLSKGETVVITFSPHPIKVLKPEKRLELLTTLDEKIALIESAGINHLVIIPFTKEFSQLSYEDFVKQMLIDKINMKGMLVGHDNTIGKNKEGSFEQLKGISKKYDFLLYIHSELKVKEGKLSSSFIRKLLTEGKLFESAKLLGHPYFVSGAVIKGQHIGNKLGFPTANIEPQDDKFIPAKGVYVAKVTFDDKIYNGMMNIGTRPTIDETSEKLIIEVHLFDFCDDIYNKHIRVSILRKIRDEYKFDDIDALRQQLKRDKASAIEILNLEF